MIFAVQARNGGAWSDDILSISSQARTRSYKRWVVADTLNRDDGRSKIRRWSLRTVATIRAGAC